VSWFEKNTWIRTEFEATLTQEVLIELEVAALDADQKRSGALTPVKNHVVFGDQSYNCFFVIVNHRLQKASIAVRSASVLEGRGKRLGLMLGLHD
jgi:hypothetical protein